MKGVWYLEPINEIDYEVESLELLNQTEVVFLNTRQEIWSYNLNTKLKKFVDSGYQGIDSSVVPNRIWLSKNSNIYEVNREGVTSDDFVVDIDNLYLNHVLIVTQIQNLI
ncbi:hypothetical protein HC766_03440 [Candidatus Gracilibacteria bacterium]|nr:hypothetical protein [Candidatus Gracilibacteria bacterium]